MELKRMLLWLMLALLPLFLLTGCGDLEPEMQDTRTVILKMDLHEKTSSRTSRASAVDTAKYSHEEGIIAAYHTHLILALTEPNWKPLSENYTSFSTDDWIMYFLDNYNNSFSKELMNPQYQCWRSNCWVILEIPLNTNMKIVAFLFSGTHSELQLITGTHEVGYFGESGSFTIGKKTKETDSHSEVIGLIQATTNTETGTSPTVTFSPADGATGVAISSNITITFDEAVRNTDDSPLTNSNVDSLITLNDAIGADIAFDATIDANKKVITINPTYYLTYSQTVYVAISASVEDSSGNPITASSATFTAEQYLQY